MSAVGRAAPASVRRLPTRRPPGPVAPPAAMAVLKLLGMEHYFHLAADEREALALALGGES